MRLRKGPREGSSKDQSERKRRKRPQVWQKPDFQEIVNLSDILRSMVSMMSKMMMQGDVDEAR